MNTHSGLQDYPSRSVATICAIAMTALAIAMGVGRFAFTPLLPFMIRDGLLTPNAGAWLAGSNYLGYMLGAMIASRIGLSLQSMLRVSLVGTVAVTLGMAAVNDVAAWAALRFIAGLFSAWALVSTSSWVLSRLGSAQRSDLAGLVYAGVGIGIALVGVFCLVVSQPGVSSQSMWLELGALAAIVIAVPIWLLDQPSEASARKASSGSDTNARTDNTGLVICYGALGFGYILPATFLPVLAREIVDDPRVFGLAWPIFGVAAALSTIAAALLLRRMNRLRVWAYCHVFMAFGVVVPSYWLSPIAIAIAALLVGSTFMVVTMIGMQEARARCPLYPMALLGKMTAAFAAGQLAGPLAPIVLGALSAGHASGLNLALQAAAAVLGLSAAYLFYLIHCDATSSRRADIPEQWKS